MRITRKMIRDRRKNINPLNELLIIINQYFPNFYNWLDSLTDSRNKSYVTYDVKVCLVVRILALCTGIQSMNAISRDFNNDETIENINKILKENYVELPHKDTIQLVINELKYNELENIQNKIAHILIRSKMLDKYRYNGMFQVAIDGTQLYSTPVNLGDEAITKTYNKGKDNEYTLYSYYVLETKIVCGNMVFSLASEFVENEIYTDEEGNKARRFDKQDCELKAAYILLEKIHNRFPKLHFLITADALYIILGNHFLNWTYVKFLGIKLNTYAIAKLAVYALYFSFGVMYPNVL